MLQVAPMMLVLVALLALGGLAVVTFAIAKNRPSVLAWLGGAILLLIVVGMMASFVAVGHPRMVQEEFSNGVPQFLDVNTGPVTIKYEGPRDWSAGSHPATFGLAGGPAGRPSLIGLLVPLIGLLVLGAIVFAIVRLFRRPHHEGRGRGGWGIVLAIFVFLALPFVFLVSSHQRVEVVRNEQQHAQRQLNRAQQQVEQARRRTEQLQRHVEATAAAKAKIAESLAKVESDQPMHRLFDEVTKPRIDLAADDQSGSVKVTSRTKTIEARGSRESDASASAPAAQSPDATVESLNRTMARLEKLVEQTTEVAQEVTEVGTIMGKAMVALRESIGSPPDAASPDALSQDPAPSALAPPAAEQYVAAKASAVATSDEAPVGAVAPSPAARADSSDAVTIEPSAAASNPPRPAWVDVPPKRVGEVWREVVVVGDYVTTDECYREADLQLMLVTYNHLARLTGMANYQNRDRGVRAMMIGSDGREVIDEHDLRMRLLRYLGINIDYIRRQIVPEDGEYFEAVDRSVGPMWKLHTLVEFTPGVDRDLRERWIAYQREERFEVVGVGTGFVLGVIGFVFGLLKIDTWTRGYYTKRLFLGVPLVIIGLVALLALMVS